MFVGGDDLDTSRSQFASAAAARRQKVQDAKTANANLPIDKVRKACLARGVCGIKSIGRYVQIIVCLLSMML